MWGPRTPWLRTRSAGRLFHFAIVSRLFFCHFVQLGLCSWDARTPHLLGVGGLARKPWLSVHKPLIYQTLRQAGLCERGEPPETSSLPVSTPQVSLTREFSTINTGLSQNEHPPP